MHVFRSRAPAGPNCNSCAATQSIPVAHLSGAGRRIPAFVGFDLNERVCTRGVASVAAFRPGSSIVSSSSAMTAILNDGKSSALRKLVVDGVDESAVVQVKFCLKYRTSYGQSVKIIGSHPKLGSWDVNQALVLQWTEGDRWVATVELPAGAVYEYKYVLVDHDSRVTLAWQGGGNSVLALGDQDEQGVEVQDNWGNNPGQAAVLVNGVSTTRETKLQAWAAEMRQYRALARNAQHELSRKSEELQASKAQIARLKMELSVSLKARDELESRVAEMESENLSLRAQVAQSQIAMKSTLEEAIKLLQQEIEEGEEELYGEEAVEDFEELPAAVNGNGKGASSSNGSGSPWGWGRGTGGKEAETVYAGSSSSNTNGATFERFGFRLSGSSFDTQGEPVAARSSQDRGADAPSRVSSPASGNGSGHVLADWRARLSGGGQ
ncbi:hypothetical protein PLESTB_001395300 [Pleodorina starrii]|uniref:CBM20 domain-containing protein n=1 Tax=Pleodorina starrii TaxID=330485 RepID=A0A9W6BVY6_9CHLO|nr:hypothetical protein PLESTM_000537000 [Pleodorina starrii]GLC58735.1 hypothetical protein PLESTB_001395300 [Pleodorina starrii]GLC75180.1 hypothetical protein PLESTF_001603800 [Pleodorina starrii]